MREGRRVNPEPIAPEPDHGWSRQIITEHNAAIYPPVSAAMRQHAGILSADGTRCTQGATWRHERRLILPPKRMRLPLPLVAGRWRWTGPLFGHRGHFLTKSTARLWALDVVRRHLDGIMFKQNGPMPMPA